MKYDIARVKLERFSGLYAALVLKGKLSEDDVVVANDLADHIIGMLTSMIKKLEKRI